MVEVNKVLEENGLSRNEVKVYLACLRSGPLSVPELRKKTGLVESTARDNFRFLIKKGLVSRTVRKDKQVLYRAENPQVLADGLRKRVANLQAAMVKLRALKNRS